jgi:hypothetical protein
VVGLTFTLIAKLGAQLVNWQNPGRAFDYAALEKYHSLRGANLLFVASTRSIETSDINQAIDRYRQAFNNLREYEGLTIEEGIVAELNRDLRVGDLTILDRLTLCLVRTGLLDEARADAERYFEAFPGARKTRIGQRVLKRVRPNSSDSDSDVGPSKASTSTLLHRGKGRGQEQLSQNPIHMEIAIPSDPVERNLRGRELEREGFVENAIEFYQANVRDGFEGSFPYDRLAVIFRQRGYLASEIAVLNRAIEVFSALQNSPRTDVSPKLAQFMTRLSSAQRLANKKGQKLKGRSGREEVPAMDCFAPAVTTTSARTCLTVVQSPRSKHSQTHDLHRGTRSQRE